MQISITVSETPESQCLLDFCKKRMNKKLGTIILFTGGTGSGKSYSGSRFLELWYTQTFHESFPITHVCENLEQAILLVKDFKRIGEGILIEELSVLAGVRDSLTTSNKLWNKFLDTCRIKQAVIVGNCPHISFIDKHFQMMCNAWVDCLGVDFDRGVVMAKPLWLQTSPHKSEPYKHKFIGEEGFPIDICYFKKPSDEYLKQYDAVKLEGVNEMYDEIALKMSTDRISRLDKLGRKLLSPRQLEAYKLWLSGCSNEDATKEMGLNSEKVFRKYLETAKNKLKDPKYAHLLREFDKMTQEDSKTESPTRDLTHLQEDSINDRNL